MLMVAPLAYRPFMATVDMTLPSEIAVPPPGQMLNYTLEMFPSGGVRIASAQYAFITLPTDTLSNQQFTGDLDVALVYRRSILTGTGIGGKSNSGYGELQINNAGANYDATYQTNTIDGRRVLLKYGWINASGIPASYDTYPTLLDGVAQDWFLDDNVLRVTIRANGFKLDVPASPNKYSGAGGINGSADVAGKRKPRAFGDLIPDTNGVGGNVTVPLIDPTNLVYQVNDGNVLSIPKVYDSGYALPTPGSAGPDADYSSYANLIAATIPAGHYATCLALGVFRLGSPAYGLVTCDVRGDVTPTFVSDSASILRRVVSVATTISGVDEGSFIKATAAQPAAIGYFIGIDESKSVEQMFADILSGAGGWFDFRRDGILVIGIVILPAGTPVQSYTTVDVVANTLRRVELPTNFNPPPKTQRATWGRNWTVQVEISSGVSATRMQALKDPYGVALTTNAALAASVAAAHLSAQDPDPIQSYFTLQADAVMEANRQFILKSNALRSIYSFKVKSKGLIHDVGDVIMLTYPRFDLAAVKLGLVIGIEDDTTEKTIEITIFVGS